MSATNLTKNLKLSQFVASDKPSWLGDVNGDNKKIDDGYGVLAGEISKANNTASSAKSQSDANTQTLTNVNSELEDYGNRITALEAGGGTEQLEQRVNTLSTDVESLQTRADTFEGEISQNGTDITALNGKVATIEPKVNANTDNITTLNNTMVAHSESITHLTTKVNEAKNLANDANSKALVNEGKINSINNLLNPLNTTVKDTMPTLESYAPLNTYSGTYFPSYVDALRVGNKLNFLGVYFVNGMPGVADNTVIAEFNIPESNKIIFGLGVESSVSGIANNTNKQFYLEKQTNGHIAIKCTTAINSVSQTFVKFPTLVFSE